MAADMAADMAAIVTTVVHTEYVSNTGTLAMDTCIADGFGGHTANPGIPLKKGANLPKKPSPDNPGGGFLMIATEKK
jgi:hypothetical protein